MKIQYGGITYSLVRFAIYCNLCNTTIESKDIHDYIYCPCGSAAIDGGLVNGRIIGNLDAIESRCMYSRRIGNKDIWLPQEVIEYNFKRFIK